MNTYKCEKEELIKSGKYEEYVRIKRQVYREGYEISDDPNDFGLSDQELDIIKRIEKSTKRKKQDCRRHVYFMNEYYDNVGLLTLTFSGKALDRSSLEQKKEVITNVLKDCFEDYIGKLEISPNGRLHGHFITAWNGEIETREVYRNGFINEQVVNTSKLTSLWYGEKGEDGQPTKYGVYDLILVPRDKESRDKTANYTLKSLNTMESYIQKEEDFLDDVQISKELKYQVNRSSVLTPRGTPYQEFKRLQNEQDKKIRDYARTFDDEFFQANKFNPRYYFRDWAERNKNTNISIKPGTHKSMFDEDFKIVNPKEMKNETITDKKPRVHEPNQASV